MSMPGFTAESSLAKIAQRHVLTAEAQAKTGKILPQGFHVVPDGNDYDLVYCDPNAGCFVVSSTSDIRKLL